MRLRIAAIVCTILIGFISLDISSSLVSKSLAQETHKHENKKQSEMGRKAPIYIADEEIDKVGVPDNWSFTLPAGDPKDGRQVFVKMECFKCHRIASENFPHIDSKASDVGPELTDEGAHHPVGFLVESIINPNAVIITGEGYTGSDGLFIMPDFTDSLTLRQFIDLVAYVKSVGGEGHTDQTTEMSQKQAETPDQTTTNADPEGRVFNVEIKNRKVSKDLRVIRVKQGDQVTLKWTTDEPAKIHLHGYSIEKEVKPGETMLLTFKAYATGRFSITNHGFGGQSHDEHKQSHEGHGGETPLLYLEVLP